MPNKIEDYNIFKMYCMIAYDFSETETHAFSLFLLSFNRNVLNDHCLSVPRKQLGSIFVNDWNECYDDEIETYVLDGIFEMAKMINKLIKHNFLNGRSGPYYDSASKGIQLYWVPDKLDALYDLASKFLVPDLESHEDRD